MILLRCRRHVVITGVVQGVGFRPHVRRLAEELHLGGWCRNDSTSVVIEVEGPTDRVDEFVRRVVDEAPRLARVLSATSTELAPSGDDQFEIVTSLPSGGDRTLVSPDAATCPECLAEMRNRDDRRYQHPFITCTQCGPRFTITRDLPYDRPLTTMAEFEMCAACQREYDQPDDRRHHAQPISCHDCGPRLSLVRPTGEVVSNAITSAQVISAVAAALADGQIVAIKGIGGFHLACDAGNSEAVARLRARKRRPAQPFAVMAPDLAVAAELVQLSEQATTALSGVERPIVVVAKEPDAPVCAEVAPGLDELGVMLPYAPLHHLIFDALAQAGAVRSLVMTSGNLSGEPLCVDNDDALARLAQIADLFCLHDRPIEVPCEDSVLAFGETGVVPVRRSRGWAPLPVRLPDTGRHVVLAAGAELKNTFALARDGSAFVSAHIGDMGTLESRTAQARAVQQAVRFHRVAPDLVVADLHPGYASRAWALEFAEELGVPCHGVQHHHAHLAALAAEHDRLDQRILGIVMDGTGYGCDRSIWGGEFLLLDDAGLTAHRLAHLGAVRLPGGDAGVRNPIRQAALALLAIGEPLDLLPDLSSQESAMLASMWARGTGFVTTSSAGRLFDIASALIGVCARSTYEAQAAVELEAAARGWQRLHPADDPAAELHWQLPTEGRTLDADCLVGHIVRARRDGVPSGRMALAFHQVLARSTAALALQLTKAQRVDTVGLTGGVFGNRLLLALTTAALSGEVEILTHRVVPPNDGGLSLGQVAVGVKLLAMEGN